MNKYSGGWNYGCRAGYIENAFIYASENDIYDEETYKYQGEDRECKTSGLRPKTKIKLPSFARPRSFDPHAVKKELVKGPVAASISASSPIFKFYAMGIIDDLALSGHSHMICNTGHINHAVTIVGWGRDENFNKDYFIIKNSFGDDWGQDGFAKIAVNNNQQYKAGTCGILSAVFGLA